MGIFGKTTRITANKITDFTVNMAKYGAVVPEILGTTRVGGNVIYYDDFTAHEHTEKQGKGGNKTITTSYTYTVAIIIALCEGEITGIGQVWRGQDIYTYPNESIELTLFSGTANQEPWAYTTAKHQDKALPYANLAYMAGVVDLGDSASMPTFNFEVKGKLLETGDGVDVNPADYVLYILDKVGLGGVEVAGIDNYRAYCAAADILISTPNDEDTASKPARDTINEIMKLTNSYMFWSNNRFKIVPLEDRVIGKWQPNKEICYFLTADDFIPQTGGALVTYQRKDSSEIYNLYPVEYVDRENGYETQSVSYVVTEDIADYGLRQASSTQAHYLYTKARAVALAERLARQAQIRRNKYTFKLDWSFCRLEVGDIVVLTDENCGLENQPAVIDSVTEDKTGTLTLTAYAAPSGKYTYQGQEIQLGEGSTLPNFNVNNRARPSMNYNVDPGDTEILILSAPKNLVTTSQGYECWIGGKGGANWGGFDLYISDTGTQFKFAGKQEGAARFGTLAGAVTASATVLTVKTNGSYVSGTADDAAYGNTLCWLDGECLSYEGATLQANGTWELSGCVRGQYGTSAVVHKSGVKFARLDDSFFKVPYGVDNLGRTFTLKCPSFNVFGNATQDISEVDSYTYTTKDYKVGGEIT